MRKIQFLLVILCVIVLLSSCSIKRSSNIEKYYQEDEYEFVGPVFAGNRIVPESFDELERYYRYGFDNSPDDDIIIARCEVIGPSINRIIEPSLSEMDYSKVYGENHVLTPIKICEIYYAGSNVSVGTNEELYLIEPYFYITESAKDYYKAFGENKIYTYDYTPLKKGADYIVYMRLRNDDIYSYNDAVVLDLCGRQEAVYCIDSEDKARVVVKSDDIIYWSIWKDVLNKYIQ